MNRLELLEQMYNSVTYNLSCYSTDYSMTKPKIGYEEEWNKELEKSKIINDMINEEKNSNFQLYTSMYSLNNQIGLSCHKELAYLENRDKGISCYLLAEDEGAGKLNYYLTLTIHKKDNFEDEYENVYARDIQKDSFQNRETLKSKMQSALDIFDKFIEKDKKSNKVYSRYYEEETEEFE